MFDSSSPLRIGYVPEHYLLPLHLSTFPFPVQLVPFPSGTGHMITSFRSDSIDLAIGLTEGWVAGLLTPQGQRERGYKIVGRWVQNPLRWAIVTGRNREDIGGLADLQTHRKVGVSRLGSGSHIMASVLAQQEGWSSSSGQSKTLDIVPLGPLSDLIAGVTGKECADPTADFFMWEHFTTKPHFHPKGSPLKKIGEIYTPWPSWHIAASEKRFPRPESDEMLAKVFEVLDRGIKRFNSDAEVGVRMLGTGELGCYYSEVDAREWLTKAKFVDETRGVDRQVLAEVVKVLQGAGVVDTDTSITNGDGVIGIEKT
ncbi:hypothetical protein EPUS_04480 [Endocarpon pusillum Z07020]|uniref:Ca3427-like PBP 2 domain-containing protein n=1 Tax=Endocarpon pusillum (strain Z07020 / HMAS-L-300199) TaxID=1263415 RepID=U1I0E6_ENDPU|nr:uncharacterized protein EPUS_04480 [Endocarpon pusillum Z07020]ERF76660.1 hypothetical protein EPUS_04480 [Endocarpon pusillum Z07020]